MKLPFLFAKFQKTIPERLRWIGENAFLGFLLLFLVALLISGMVFYRYVWSLQYIETPPVVQTSFENALFQDLLATWELHEEAFRRVGESPSPNIFVSPSLE